jgi:hypothetical protein
MTIVIPFAPTSATLRRKSAQAEPGAPRESAAILFFTGVRYERQPETALTDVGPRKRRAAGGKRLARAAAAGQPV